jgi:alpha-aminoadipic semialdehyde synthase
MPPLIGIRREDKNRWERRVPLVPADLAELQTKHGLRFLVQPSPIRVYDDERYRAAGITVTENLDPASIIFAVKEIPLELLHPGKTYVYFAHVVKAQPYNMPMLERLMDLGCSLVDYERITDEENRRLIFFGRHAGSAGMIDTLRALGQRLAVEGIPTPLSEIRSAHDYHSLPEAKAHLHYLGRRISRDGLPESLTPLVFGFSGYGNVSQGAQEILEFLPVTEISVSGLPSAAAAQPDDRASLLKVVFKEEHLVEPVQPGGSFDLRDYYEHPERYRGVFERYLPYLDVLVNAIYWEARYPRLVTAEWARKAYAPGERPRLRVIGDISCDIEGSVELTHKSTPPDHPCYVYDPSDGSARDGVEGNGPVIMAVDNLPCELPRESSNSFSEQLKGMVPVLAAADWSADLAEIGLPPHLERALIVHRGELAPAYAYLEKHAGA